jgi:ELWxxDGT repeat protein
VLVRDIATGTEISDPENFIEFNSELYFTANDRVHGDELWKTDGTPGGTVLAADIDQAYLVPTSTSSLPTTTGCGSTPTTPAVVSCGRATAPPPANYVPELNPAAAAHTRDLHRAGGLLYSPTPPPPAAELSLIAP